MSTAGRSRSTSQFRDEGRPVLEGKARCFVGVFLFFFVLEIWGLTGVNLFRFSCTNEPTRTISFFLILFFFTFKKKGRNELRGFSPVAAASIPMQLDFSPNGHNTLPLFLVVQRSDASKDHASGKGQPMHATCMLQELQFVLDLIS
jgi:hypothetical protein